MKVIKIGNVNVSFEGKMYGRGGEYTVTDEIAKALQAQGHGKVIKNISKDRVEQRRDLMPPNEIFLNEVRRHAPQIIQILEEYKRSQEIDEMAFEDVEDESVEDEVTIDENIISNDGSDENQITLDDAGDSETDDEIDSLSENKNDDQDDEDESGASELPERFPGRNALIEAGITTLDKVPKTREELLEVPGIGERTANLIGVHLKKLGK